MKHDICLLVLVVLLSGLTVAFGAPPDPTAEPVADVIRATIDISRPVGPFSPVPDMITPWNSKGNRMPFAPGSAYDRRFHEANFGMCRVRPAGARPNAGVHPICFARFTGRRKLRCHAPEQGRTSNRFQPESIESLRQRVSKICDPV